MLGPPEPRSSGSESAPLEACYNRDNNNNNNNDNNTTNNNNNDRNNDNNDDNTETRLRRGGLRERRDV